jgi:hypothetical protein
MPEEENSREALIGYQTWFFQNLLGVESIGN